MTPLRRSGLSPASELQRRKVAGRPCLVCGRQPVDPAHLVPRSLGGCDEPDRVVPLCRRCHRAYDGGELDLLRHLEPGCRVELAHALRHLSLLALLRRVTGVRWEPVDALSEENLPARGPRQWSSSSSVPTATRRRPRLRRRCTRACWWRSPRTAGP